MSPGLSARNTKAVGVAMLVAASRFAIEAAAPGLERYRAAVAYIEAAGDAASEGRALRDVELRELCKEHGPKLVSELTGASLGTVKAANHPFNDRPAESVDAAAEPVDDAVGIDHITMTAFDRLTLGDYVGRRARGATAEEAASSAAQDIVPYWEALYQRLYLEKRTDR